jgi:hypothetical protein
VVGLPAEVEVAVKENEGENMNFFNVEMLKDLSVEDMERLRREIRKLNQRVRKELDSRERYCAYCGDQLGTLVYGFKYCSAWHKYLDGHKNTATVSRVEFERKRAISRIRTIKKVTDAPATLSENSNPVAAAELKASLRNLKIRRVLNEYQTITGQSLNQSIRDNRRFKAADQ